MKELTFNVTCNTAYEMRDYHHNMKIKIKRNDNDTSIQDARQYMKKLIILVNRAQVPMLFCAVDYNKLPKTGCWHVIYKLNKDEKCPFVTLRLYSKKADFAKQ